MKAFLRIYFLCWFFFSFAAFTQEVTNTKYHPDHPFLVIPKNHDPNIESLPKQSFYKSKDNWKQIIDSTWGPGASTTAKQALFNSYCTTLQNNFDGFLSLQLNWDSLKSYYYNQINDSTSRGGFDAIMDRFYMTLRDFHTYADDKIVFETPLNPGVPLMIISGFYTIEHFGAVLTVLPDSNLLVLRAVDNHPLNLEPGDIIIGYEGIPWKILVNELYSAGLPIVGYGFGSETSRKDAMLITAGMNWHLFDTIDIIKHTAGDTVHLSVQPLISLSLPPMLNNEQISIPGVPFPDYFNGQLVSYGIIENTNIGYIYLYSEWPQAESELQFFQAVDSLKNTDALIIDMRINFGGWALFYSAFNILFNESPLTIEDAHRCNTVTFDLCPVGNATTYKIAGVPPNYYDRPVAVLLGSTCVSMGDVTAQRFRYHPMVKFFGKSPVASLGDNSEINTNPEWFMRYSRGDMFHVNQPGQYLNRAEFPIDFPVWHTPEDAANGKDAVVERALEWIDNLSYGRQIEISNSYLKPGIDTLLISASILNPNAHQLSNKIIIENLDKTFVDSVEMIQASSDNWVGKWICTDQENIFRVHIKTIDQTSSSSFTVTGAQRITTSGPLLIDTLYYAHLPNQKRFSIKPYLSNKGTNYAVTELKAKLICTDSWVVSITNNIISFPSVSPGGVVLSSNVCGIIYDSTFPGYFDLEFEIISDGWCYWKDSLRFVPVIVGVEEELNNLPTEFNLTQNYPNPFNSSSVIKYSIPKSSQATLKIFNTLGEELETLVNEEKTVGSYEANWNAENLPSGVYFYRLQAGDFVQTKKMILLK